MAQYGMVWHCTAWYGITQYGMVWNGTAWYGMAQYGMVWHGTAWYGMAQYGMVWHGTAIVWNTHFYLLDFLQATKAHRESSGIALPCFTDPGTGNG
jgi:chloride channel 2